MKVRDAVLVAAVLYHQCTPVRHAVNYLAELYAGKRPLKEAKANEAKACITK